MVCEHENKKPYYYGYMNSDFIKNDWETSNHYGGATISDGNPKFFCSDCLEDIFE
jgi:hypothetical protein